MHMMEYTTNTELGSVCTYIHAIKSAPLFVLSAHIIVLSLLPCNSCCGSTVYTTADAVVLDCWRLV